MAAILYKWFLVLGLSFVGGLPKPGDSCRFATAGWFCITSFLYFCNGDQPECAGENAGDKLQAVCR